MPLAFLKNAGLLYWRTEGLASFPNSPECLNILLSECSVLLREIAGIFYSYLVGYCPICDLFGKGEPNIGSPLSNKSDIGQAADHATVLIFPPKILVYASLVLL